jgi:hypothetical protein
VPATFTIERDRQWYVLVITRERQGREAKVRHVYLSSDEMTDLIRTLVAEGANHE